MLCDPRVRPRFRPRESIFDLSKASETVVLTLERARRKGRIPNGFVARRWKEKVQTAREESFKFEQRWLDDPAHIGAEFPRHLEALRKATDVLDELSHREEERGERALEGGNAIFQIPNGLH